MDFQFPVHPPGHIPQLSRIFKNFGERHVRSPVQHEAIRTLFPVLAEKNHGTGEIGIRQVPCQQKTTGLQTGNMFLGIEFGFGLGMMRRHILNID